MISIDCAGMPFALPPSMKLTSLACTHIGRRTNNEDNYCVVDSAGLFAVADGMGGYEGGEVASKLAIDALRDFVERNTADDDVTWPYALDHALSLEENMLLVGVRLAHEHITSRRNGRLAQMGATLAAMIVRHRRAVIAHIGDSRVYRLRDGQLIQLTRDHSLYQELLDSGTEVPSRDDFRYRNIVTRALGIEGMPEVTTTELSAGDVYLLCSDGLSDPLSDDDIAAVLRGGGTSACRDLVERAYAAGGSDNITAVVVQCH